MMQFFEFLKLAYSVAWKLRFSNISLIYYLIIKQKLNKSYPSAKIG